MQQVTKRKGWRIWLLSLAAMLMAFNLSAQVTVEIGTGTNSASFPFYTLYEDGRTQIIYDASEILAGGGMAGDITAIAFNLISTTSYPMNGFNIDMQNYSGSTLSGMITTGWTNVYSGSYTVPAAGWQTITLQTPFAWDGTSNLLINICFDNSSWSGSSPVNSTAVSGKTWWQYGDGGAGCSYTGGSAQTNRPNIRLTIAPPPVVTVECQVGTGTTAVGYPFYTFYMDSRT
ncbi:MAG TPA: hypothetical protein PLV51_13495, partial [Lentimicrobium sp.]|nr:hypothetical protein [Lentimicrobium sp.]